MLLSELFGSESKSQVYGSLHTFFQENQKATSDICKIPIFTLGMARFACKIDYSYILYCFPKLIACICYDDACHLKKYACNTTRSGSTLTSSHIASLDIAIDKLHFRGHVDSWCHHHCNPYKLDRLKEVHHNIYYAVQDTFSRIAINVPIEIIHHSK